MKSALLLTLTLILTGGRSTAALAAPESSIESALSAETPYVLVKGTSCGEEPQPNLSESSVCSRKTLPEQITWSLGHKCEKSDDRKFIAAHAGELELVDAVRRKIYETYSAPKIIEDLSSQEPRFLHDLETLTNYLKTQARLSKTERVLLYSYFQTGYIRINGALWKGGALAECIAPLVQRLNSILGKMPRFEGTVWRGVHLPQSVVDPYVVGQEVAWPAYSSTSVDRTVAEVFSRSYSKDISVLFKIQSKSCVDVRGASPKLKEQEVLCLPGTRFKVTQMDAPNVITLEEITFNFK